MSMALQSRSIEALWQDYWFLTQEMSKFLARQDMDMFYNLMAQREQFQVILEQSDDRSFGQKPEGKALLGKIQQENQSIQLMLRAIMNKMRQQQAVSDAYGGGSAQPNVGLRFNRGG